MGLKLYRRSDSPNWWLRGSVRGISVYESTKTDNQEAAETIRILREQELLDESIFGKKHTVTFHQAAEAYLSSGGSERFLQPLMAAFGTKRLRDLHQADLDAAARKLYPQCSAGTINRQCHTPFIAVWNHAARNVWAPVRLWQRPRKAKGTAYRKTRTRSGDRPVDYAHAAQFVANLSPAPAMVMTALFYTGMRPIELFTLEAGDVNLDQRWIVLHNTKTGEPRGVPMHEFLVPLFASLLKRRDKWQQLFRTFKGRPYSLMESSGGQLSNAMTGARRRLAKRGVLLTDISPYTARHTVSTQLVVNGIHPHIKDQILGHAVDSMSRRYTQVPQAPLIAAINTLPVPDPWRCLEWWSDPLAFSRRHIKWGTVQAAR
ncbi:integrase [Rhizobium azooxidifex]|uniref:Integrase n=1 Tax=Mycoplana azooxidifex TaxID=1636188 RepID=A0A7W6GJM0_9HYPH|nr:site-specific integrase [Mycoplana azooxidifex]MBB3978166.1 integrase [Mycoplana azooxidifex]